MTKDELNKLIDKYWANVIITHHEIDGGIARIDTTILPNALSVIAKCKVALEIISKRPDLPNPERDADWKNCMKWSAQEAAEALTEILKFEQDVTGIATPKIKGVSWGDYSPQDPYTLPFVDGLGDNK